MKRVVMHDEASFQRVFLIVLDSVGIGEMPDAALFGDEGTHTLKHIAEQMNGLHMPNMQALGLGNIVQVPGIEAVPFPQAYYGSMAAASTGKDTMTGHWELMGLRVEEPFRTFTQTGFPANLLEQIVLASGRKVLGNKAASGTEIIEELGQEHILNGDLIIYTSADSVIQIAAHENVVPLQELYEICQMVRDLTLQEPYRMGRVIARPFKGRPGSFERTSNRKDYAVKPNDRTVMNELKDAGLECIAIGKIDDIYDGEGVTRVLKTKSNMDGMDHIIATAKQTFKGLSFVNLVDFDALYGHRRDPLGYGQALQEFDARLPELITYLSQTDLLIITADHGNDPTHRGTDHTREFVPILAFSPRWPKTASLGTRTTFADIGATIADTFQLTMPAHGQSFLREMT